MEVFQFWELKGLTVELGCRIFTHIRICCFHSGQTNVCACTDLQFWTLWCLAARSKISVHLYSCYYSDSSPILSLIFVRLCFYVHSQVPYCGIHCVNITSHAFENACSRCRVLQSYGDISDVCLCFFKSCDFHLVIITE